MQRSARPLGILLWLCCLAIGLWSAQLAMQKTQGSNYNQELKRIEESLTQLQGNLPADSLEKAYLAGAVQNLRATQEGAILLDQHTLLGLSMLAVIGLGMATLLIITLRRSEDPITPKVQPPQQASAPSPETVDHYLSNLESTADELRRICGDLTTLDNSPSVPASRSSGLVEAQFDQIVRIESHLLRLRGEIAHTLGHVKDVADRLQRLTTQCEDNAHFGAATRLEWNNMGRKLRQIKEGHDKIKGTADKIMKQQSVCSELLIKTLDFGTVHNKHSESAREHVQRMHEISRSTLGTLDLLAHSMAESNQDVGTASSLVRGLSERAEEIVNIIDVIDDIAEQTNQLALNASIEAARAGEQGQGFAVVAGEVRNLAARSSTATKSITDLLGTIQQEADHASSCLEKSRKSVAVAHSRMLEVDRTYREAVTLSRQSLAELNDLIADVTTHMQELKVIEKQNSELKKYCITINNQLDEHSRLTSVTHTESNQLTIHSDRLSRLLNRQYFEMSHCDRLVEGAFFSLEDIKERIDEGIATSESLRSAFQQSYHQSLQQDPQLNRRGTRMARIVSILQGCRKNLELITATPEAIRSELGDAYRLAENARSNVARDEAPPIKSDADTVLPADDVLIGDPNDSQKAS